MENEVCSWTPALIADLVKGVAWPLVALVIGIGFRTRISEAARSFFSTNTVSEVSASPTGLSAKFVAAKQTSETLDAGGSNATNLPRTMSIDAVRERHNQHLTEFSDELYRAVTAHLDALTIGEEEKIELLAREISLLQSAIRYFDINKVLFRSQFNLFSLMSNNNGYIAKEDAHRHFSSTKELVGAALFDWDWIKYISYPVSHNLISEDLDGYKLTSLGRSYVSFMSKNPQLIDELAKL